MKLYRTKSQRILQKKRNIPKGFSKTTKPRDILDMKNYATRYGEPIPGGSFKKRRKKKKQTALRDNLPYTKDKKRIRRKRKTDIVGPSKGKIVRGSRIGTSKGGVGKTYSTNEFNKSRKYRLKEDDGSVTESNEDPEEAKRKRELEKFKDDVMNDKLMRVERHDGDDLLKDLNISEKPVHEEDLKEEEVEVENILAPLK